MLARTVAPQSTTLYWCAVPLLLHHLAWHHNPTLPKSLQLQNKQQQQPYLAITRPESQAWTTRFRAECLQHAYSRRLTQRCSKHVALLRSSFAAAMRSPPNNTHEGKTPLPSPATSRPAAGRGMPYHRYRHQLPCLNINPPHTAYCSHMVVLYLMVPGWWLTAIAMDGSRHMPTVPYVLPCVSPPPCLPLRASRLQAWPVEGERTLDLPLRPQQLGPGGQQRSVRVRSAFRLPLLRGRWPCTVEQTETTSRAQALAVN